MFCATKKHYICIMKLIAAKKDETIYFGNIVKIASLIKVYPNTVSRWISAKKKVVHKNGYEVYFNTEKL